MLRTWRVAAIVSVEEAKLPVVRVAAVGIFAVGRSRGVLC